VLLRVSETDFVVVPVRRHPVAQSLVPSPEIRRKCDRLRTSQSATSMPFSGPTLTDFGGRPREGSVMGSELDVDPAELGLSANAFSVGHRESVYLDHARSARSDERDDLSVWGAENH
jgi:hypothetical protein